MNKVSTFLFAIAILWVSTCCAQPSGYTLVSGGAANSIAQKITSTSSKMNTLQVDFTQEKSSKALTSKVVSKGKMSYKKTNFLRWTYTSPSSYSIILNERGAFLKKGNSSTPNKALGELGGLIARTIGGNGLVNNNDFTISYYKSNDILVYMIPKNKRLQTMYKSMEVYLNPQSYLATKVKLFEKNGDVTTITFSNHKQNVTLPATEFKE